MHETYRELEENELFAKTVMAKKKKKVVQEEQPEEVAREVREAEAHYEAVRKTVRERLLYGFFGPPKGGVFSISLQATIYDAGCLALAAAPSVSREIAVLGS